MSFSPLKILYLITDLNIGGTEKILYELVTRIDRTKFNPLVCGLKSYGHYAEKIENKGIPVIVFNVANGISLLKNFQAIFNLYKIMRKEKIDLVHTFLFRANFIGRIAARLVGVPIVISSIRVMEEKKKYHLFLERITSFLSDKFIVNSEALKNFVSEKMKITPEKIEIVYNGIDFMNLPKINSIIKKNELGYNKNEILIGTVGRLHKQKGIEYFIEAIKIITQLPITPPSSALGGLRRAGNYQLPNFLIIGDGPERKNLESLICNLELNDKVKLLGWRTDVLEIISVLDIFVLSSLWEGTPNVVLEALAYNKPVVATRVGGVPEIIEEGVTGLLVEPANAQALADAILWVLENPEKARKMAEKGKEKVEKFFPIHKMVKETEEVYEKLANLKESRINRYFPHSIIL